MTHPTRTGPAMVPEATASGHSRLAVTLATTGAELRAAQRLRYEVFVAELGADGPLVEHTARRECDGFDPFADHLILVDTARAADERVVGVYRLMRDDHAARAGRFTTEAEYDISSLTGSGRRLLELGRSALHPDYRGGSAMYRLWCGLAGYAQTHGIEVLFGVASFHGTDPHALAQPLAYLHHNHLAPEALRPRALPGRFQPMDLIAPQAIHRRAAIAAVPPLLRGYLRLGGWVGAGACVDHAFNTTDVCLVLDAARMDLRQRAFYTRERPG